LPKGTDSIFPERRRFRRFSVALELRYKTDSGIAGSGVSVNISSGGLLFRCGATLKVGGLIEVELEWPLLLDKQRPLLLKVYGIIVRSDADGTAMAISKHEFRPR